MGGSQTQNKDYDMLCSSSELFTLIKCALRARTDRILKIYLDIEI